MEKDQQKRVVTKADIVHIATLCRIGVTENDLEKLTGELATILDLFTVINLATTDNVSTDWGTHSCALSLREDISKMSMPTTETLSNAPSVQGDHLRINVVLEE